MLLVKLSYYLKPLYGVRECCVYDVSDVQGICTIKEILSLCRQNVTNPYRLRIQVQIKILFMLTTISLPIFLALFYSIKSGHNPNSYICTCPIIFLCNAPHPT